MYELAELLNQIGQPAVAVSTAPFNASVPKTVRGWDAGISHKADINEATEFVIVDISDPEKLEDFVKQRLDKVFWVIDRHPGFEKFWLEKIGPKKTDIREVGAADLGIRLV